MSRYTALLRLTIQNRLAIFRAGSLKKENGKIAWGRLATVVATILCAVMLIGMVIALEYLIYTVLSTLRHPELLPALALLVGMVGMVLMSFFYVLSSLYFSRDSEWMAYLPVKSTTVLCAKLTEICVGEALINAAIMMPAFIMYGIYLKAGTLFYLRAVLIALLSPLMPIAIITLCSTVLARVVGGIRNSTLLTTVLTFALIILLIVGEMTLIPRMPYDGGTVEQAMWLINLLLGKDALLETLTRVFPPVMWAVQALRGDALMLLLFAVVSFGSIALVIALLGRSYLRLCMKQTEHAAAKRSVKLSEKSWQGKTPLAALYQLEMRDIFRSSMYLTQCLSGSILLPLIIGFILMGGAFVEDLGELHTQLVAMLAQIAPTDLALALCAVFGYVTFVSPAAVTSVTREGKRHALLRMLPVSVPTLLNAKLLCGLSISAIALIATTLVLIVGLQINWLPMLLGLLLASLLCYASNALMLTVDAMHPSLNWTTETQAMKQNTNVLFGMLICIALMALPIAAVVLWLLNASAVLRFAIVLLILLAEAAVGYLSLRFVAVKKYQALEGV